MLETIISLILLSIIIFGTLKYIRKREDFKRSLNLTFLKVTLPKKESDLDEKKETTKDFKEMVGLMEQLYASLKSIHSSKIIKKILGQDLISFEYIAHEGEILFYVVIPKAYKFLIEKQINGFYTDAIIEETTEVNIFKDRKYSEGTYIHSNNKFLFPIKTYQKLESDPINNITGALSKLEEDESAVIQVLLKPINDDWQHHSAKASSKIMSGKSVGFSLNPFTLIMKFVGMIFSSSGEDDKNSYRGGDDTSALSQERAKTVDEKGDKTGYETVIRIIATGNNHTMVESELKNIVSSFVQFSYPDFNKLVPTINHSNKALINNYIYRYFKKPFWLKKMILNTEELASVFHFPHIKYNKVAEIKWQNFKIVKAPTNLPKEGLLLGHNVYRGVKKEVRLKLEDRFRHFYVIGQTGTGKSSIFQSMIRQDFNNGEGVVVIDPHGDLARDVMPFIPRERADDVIYFDPSDLERPMGLNMLEAHTDDEKELVAMDALNIMIKLFGNEIFGPRIQDYFRNAVLTLMDYPQGGAITDVVRLFTDPDFQKDHVRHVKNPIVKNWWEKTYASMGAKEKAEIIPYFAAKFGQFITNKMMRNIIGQTKSSFDVMDIMQNKKILLVNLSKGRLGDLNSKLLGMMLVSKIQMAAMRRDNIPKDERTECYLYIDEFQNYVTDSIESILSEARKYRLSLNIAHQYLGQLEQSDALTKSSLNLKQAIFGNVGSVMSYKIGPEDGEFMSKYFAPTFSDQDLVNMDKFKGVIKVSVDNQPTTPFSFIPLNPYLEKGDDTLAKAFVELSRLKYGRDKAFVSKEIEYRIGSV
ncbi:type IV secretory system conjugative DNA transfer family protein [Candidatus Gracilibacteria bacterium]|nr:type IV secretory system conjugative DNA transfer family protein [Candidatus Gracilibacteria bacterium]